MFSIRSAFRLMHVSFTMLDLVVYVVLSIEMFASFTTTLTAHLKDRGRDIAP